VTTLSIADVLARPAAPRDLCTDCGISRSNDPGRCGRACQFIKPDYPKPGGAGARPQRAIR
jgi:hypothetical protein